MRDASGPQLAGRAFALDDKCLRNCVALPQPVAAAAFDDLQTSFKGSLQNQKLHHVIIVQLLGCVAASDVEHSNRSGPSAAAAASGIG